MSFFNGLFKKGTDYKPEVKNVILSPVKGKLIPLESVSDPVFAQRILGVGVAVEPSEGKICAPVDGIVEAAFPTGHAVGLKSAAGAEVLIHVGVNTVELKGDGFRLLVKQGDNVKAAMDQQFQVTMQATRMIPEILNIVEEFYSGKLDAESLSYSRFLRHLQFFIRRILEPTEQPKNDNYFYKIGKKQFPEAYACVRKINQYVKKQTGKSATPEEQGYLIYHIMNMTMK